VEKRWLSPEDLLVRWQAKPFEVVDAIKRGLPLYDVMTGECYNDAETPGKICLKLQQIVPQQNSAWEYDLFNSDPWEAVEVGFKLSEVVAYEKKYGTHLTAKNIVIAEELEANTSINPEEYFPELNIHILKMQAERWVKKFSGAPIKRILLYNFSSKYEGTIIARNGLPPHPAIYAIVFDLDDIDRTTNMSAEERLQYDLTGVREERLQESYERLLAATKPNKRIADNEQYHDLMTRDFEKIYKNPPKPGYREQWQSYCKFKNTRLSANIRIDEPYIVLWQQDWGQKVQEWADEARKKKLIDILKLCHVLAYDDGSSAKLPALWRKYHMDKRGPSIPETETFEKKVVAWVMLMQCLTTGFDGAPDQGEVPYLKTCKKDRDKGVYVEAPKNEGTHVNLQTLNDYFTDTLLIPTPLPQILFPDSLEPIEPCGTAGNNERKYSPIKTPPGTKWQQIRIDLVHEGLIKITYPKGEITTTRDGLGLGGRKKKAWEEFEEFAVNKGYYDFPPGVKRRKLKDKKYRLNKILQELFPNVEGDPILYHKREYHQDHKQWFEEKYQSVFYITKIDTGFMERRSDEEEIAQEFRDHGNSGSMW